MSPSCTFQTEGEPRQLQLADSGAVGAALDSLGHGWILDTAAKTSRPLGPGIGWLSLAPGGNLLAAVKGPKLEVLDARGGRVGSLEFDAPLDRCLVARAGGRLYASNTKGEVFGFSAQGEFLWKIALGGRCDQLADDPDGSSVFTVREQRHLCALDPLTGGKKWETSTITSVTHLAPVRGGAVFAGTVEGRVAEYSGSGVVAWNPRVGERVAGLGVSLDSRFIAVADPHSVQIHGEHRTLLRRFDFADPRAMAAAPGAHLGLAAQGSGTVTMFDRERSLWSYTTTEPAVAVALSANGERACVAFSRSVLCFDLVELIAAYVREVRHRAVVARESGMPVEEVDGIAAQALHKVEARDLAGALALARSAEDALLRRREASKPDISLVAAAVDGFIPGEWCRATAFVMNTGAAHATDIQLQATAPGVDIRRRALPFLTVGEVSHLDFQIRLRAPVQTFEVEVRFWDFQGRDYSQKGSASVQLAQARGPLPRPVVFLAIGDRKRVVAAVKSKRPGAPGAAPAGAIQ